MKKIRSLSGAYFRVKREGKTEVIAFEDLSSEEQDKVMEDKNIEWIKSLAKGMADTINKIADAFDIISSGEVAEKDKHLYRPGK